MKFRLLNHLLISVLLVMVSCSPDDDNAGPVNNTNYFGDLKGSVLHHSTPIPNARVYIKYGVSEFPGTDTGAYDYGINSDDSANYMFTHIRTGKYYLYGIGYDPGIRDSVFGGIPVVLSENDIIREINVPVTE